MVFTPKVSIVIPVYNGSNYLREAIDSALAQTYKNVEVIVVNDGSNDEGKTEAIAKSYGDKIRYYYKENGGVASALNLGILKMTGEYFSWLSHDDVYYPNKIEVQINYVKNHNGNIILYSDYDFIDGESRFISTVRIYHIDPKQFRYALISSYPINGCTALIPKFCFDKMGFFKENLKTTQDYEMWFRMAKKFEFYHIPNVLIKSRLHPGQGTVTMKKTQINESNELYISFLKEITIQEILMSKEETIGLFYIQSAIALKKKGVIRAAHVALKQSLWSLAKVNLILLLKNIIRYFIADNPNSSYYYRLRKIKSKFNIMYNIL